MGVKSLWTLLDPVGRPILLETMEGKALAIDSSIWIYQFQATMRDKDGRGLVNAHLLGFLRRICKLLFYGIKPVFVFDGGAPVLKRQTIRNRKAKKSGAAESHTRVAEKLLAAQMRRDALEHIQSTTAGPSKKPILHSGTVYLEDLVDASHHVPMVSSRKGKEPATPSPSKSRPELIPTPQSQLKQDQLEMKRQVAKKKRDKWADYDPYRLPDVDLSEQVSSRTSGKAPDPRLATEDELRDFINALQPSDFDVNSFAFRELPTEIQYEIVGDLRLRSRQTSHERLTSMLRGSRSALDFSRAQIANLRQRNTLTQQLLATTDSIGAAHVAIPVRIASERGRQYVLVKNEGKDGGWVLGVREEGKTKEKPIDVDEDSEAGESDDNDGMEEVQIPSAIHDPDLRSYQRQQALEALSRRSTTSKRPPSPRKKKHAPALFLPDDDVPYPVRPLSSDGEEEEEDPELALALQMSVEDGFRNKAGESAHVDEDDEDLYEQSHRSRLATALSLANMAENTAAFGGRLAFVNSDKEVSLPNSVGMNGVRLPKEDDEDDEMEEVDMPILSPGTEFGRATGVLVEQDISHSAEGNSADKLMAQILVSSGSNNVDITLEDDEDNMEEVAMLASTSAGSIGFGKATGVLAESDDVSSNVAGALDNRLDGRAAIGSPNHANSQLEVNEEDMEEVFIPAPSSLATNAVSATATDAPPEPVTSHSAPSEETGTPSPARRSRVSSNSSASRKTKDNKIPSTPSKSDRLPSLENKFSQSEITPPKEALQTSTSCWSDASEDSGLNNDMALDGVPEEPAAYSKLPNGLAQHAASVQGDKVDTMVVPGARVLSSAGREAPERPRVHVEKPDIEESQERSRSPKPALIRVGFRSPEIRTGVAEPEPGKEEDEESISGWSRSPSPEHPAKGVDAPAEERDFANFVSQVKGRDLNDVRREIDEEIRVLNAQKKVAMRDSEDVTQQMVSQIMLMLRLFGIPYMTAPMEAEAQCAELVSLGLVDGVITDDSDVFLFGGARVYKNMFNQSKTVECFLTSDLERELGLTRETLVRLAYLLGSDYVEGLPGVGPVVAMELINEFPGEDGLHKFRDWWSRVQTGKDSAKESGSKFRRRFKKRFKELYLMTEWPNPVVRDAYYHPAVDRSEEPFKWGLPDLDALRTFLGDELSWNAAKVDELLQPILRRMNQRGQAGAIRGQSTLAGHFDTSAGMGAFAPRRRQAYSSRRLQEVVTEFRKRKAAGISESITTGESDLPSTTEQPRKKRAAKGIRKKYATECKKPVKPKGRGKKKESESASEVGEEEETMPPTEESVQPSTKKALRRRPRPRKPIVRDSEAEEVERDDDSDEFVP